MYNTNGHKVTTTYENRDVNGNITALHIREDKPDGTKDVRWYQPDGTPGLNGTKLHDLPLYGAHEIHDTPTDEAIVVVEGEKARDALEGVKIPTVGTVTGASGTPSPKALEALRDRDAILWPDNDDQGRDHMDRVADALRGIAASVSLYTWDVAPEKGDAADHPAIQNGHSKAIGKLQTDLYSAPKWQPPKPTNPLLESRMLLSEGMIHGIEPPEELEPGVLLKGKVHWLYAPGGAGKTMLMLWLVKRCIERGENVLLFDAENGRRIISERLAEMGVSTDKVDEHLYYLSSPSLTIPDQPNYLALLDEVEPALVVFDSLISFLAGAGCEENSNTDVAAWAGAFCHPARARDIAVLLIDHVPHDGAHARGATRKRDEADVQWKLNNTQPFDRESVGEIVLFREKDREAWLPPSVKFSVGGGSGGFVFARSEGTVEEPDPEDGMTGSAKEAFDLLREHGGEGATWGQLKKRWTRSVGALSNGLKELRRLNRCEQTEHPKRYYAIEHQKPVNTVNSECSSTFNDRSIEQSEQDESGSVHSVHTPYGGEQLNADVEHEPEDGEDGYQEIVL